MAPESEGNAVNMNSWSVVKLNPTLLRFTVMALNNIHTQKAKSRQATEITRFLRAIPLPLFSQKSLFSGFQLLSR